MNELKNAFPELYKISAYGYIEAVRDWHKHLGTPESLHKIDLILAVFNWNEEGGKLILGNYFKILVCFKAADILTPECMNFVNAVYKYHATNSVEKKETVEENSSKPTPKQEDAKAKDDGDKKPHECKCGGTCHCHDFKPKKKYKRTPFGLIEDDSDFYKNMLERINSQSKFERDEMNKIFDAFFGKKK